MIYSKGTHPNQCEKKSQNRCVSSMNFSTSDPATYYCAVATCGQIIFGNGTKVDLQGSQIEATTIALCAVLAVSLIVIAVLIWSFSKNKCVHCKAVAELKHRDNQKSQKVKYTFSKSKRNLPTFNVNIMLLSKRAGWIYSAAIFSLIRDDSTRFPSNADALVPVVTVQLGEPATFTCDLPENRHRRSKLYWYKQNAGDTLNLIVFVKNFAEPVYGPDFNSSKPSLIFNDTISTLTILKTTEKDEGMYHCVFIGWKSDTWYGTYLSIKGNNKKTSNLTVVQQPTRSDQLHHGGSVSLQCSLLTDAPNKTCSEDLRVFWFRSRSNKSYPDVIYMNGKRHDGCEKKPDSVNRCVFSRNTSSSDPGTYYCAVATCGLIIFGNGTKVDLQDQTAGPKYIALVIACICLVLSVIVNIIFFCYRTPRAGLERESSQVKHPEDFTTEDRPELNYAALNFSKGDTTRGNKRGLRTQECVYSQAKL
ncbi:putative LOC107374738-like protein [Nothobranchius furzeri]|uniref:LOC107374738-like protein n=1 Tax=Nothobranchius furzeri TaxID=105023 RepID=A0A9D2Y8S4_NOTFU|nr:putative LOC107374738-like protein [Nothobranchius furzeri]